MAPARVFHTCAKLTLVAASAPPAMVIVIGITSNWPLWLTIWSTILAAGFGLAAIRTCLRKVETDERGLRSLFGVARDEVNEGICLTVPGILTLQKHSLKENSQVLPAMRINAAGGVPVDLEVAVEWRLLPERLADFSSLNDVGESVGNQIKAATTSFVSLVKDSGDLVDGSVKEALSRFIHDSLRLRADGQVTRPEGQSWSTIRPVAGSERERPWGVRFINVMVTGWRIPEEMEETAIRRETDRMMAAAHAEFSQNWSAMCGDLHAAGVPADQIPAMVHARMFPNADPLPAAPDTNILLQDGLPTAVTRVGRVDRHISPKLQDRSNSDRHTSSDPRTEDDPPKKAG